MYGPRRKLAARQINPRVFLGGLLALARLETPLDFIDDVKAAAAAHDPVVAIPTTQRLQRVSNFHFLGIASISARSTNAGNWPRDLMENSAAR